MISTSKTFDTYSLQDVLPIFMTSNVQKSVYCPQVSSEENTFLQNITFKLCQFGILLLESEFFLFLIKNTFTILSL